jgi:5'-nucleotidase (lipoprotein e(P4) family)
MTRAALTCTLLLTTLLSGCRGTAAVRPPVQPAPPATAGSADKPASAKPEPLEIQWVRTSAEHVAIYLQTYAVAARRVEQAVASKPAGSWAVVLDADETVISNLEYQAERARLGEGYTPESWTAWVKRRAATPLPGAAAFLTRVRSLGGRIAIVTNRVVSECPDTEAVFQAHALPYEVILCRPDTGSSDKNPRFDAVARGTTPAGLPPLEVVAFVGDNISDFPAMSQAVRQRGPEGFAEFGVRHFVLPNPMYGSWQ